MRRRPGLGMTILVPADGRRGVTRSTGTSVLMSSRTRPSLGARYGASCEGSAFDLGTPHPAREGPRQAPRTRPSFLSLKEFPRDGACSTCEGRPGLGRTNGSGRREPWRHAVRRPSILLSSRTRPSLGARYGASCEGSAFDLGTPHRAREWSCPSRSHPGVVPDSQGVPSRRSLHHVQDGPGLGMTVVGVTTPRQVRPAEPRCPRSRLPIPGPAPAEGARRSLPRGSPRRGSS